MNQLCVPIPHASDTQQILQEVFALCRVPWIFDFIFNADPAADISMLLAPVQKRYALSARIFVKATETSSRYAHTFDYNKELMFYSMPAFSVEHITAGFCVEQPARNNAKDGLQCIRFVRDDTNGVFLHVSENERTGVTEVDCLTQKSSTRRTRVRMKFDCRSLRRVLCTAKGILHPSDISASLIYYNVSDERRTCPVCCDATVGDCACKLPLQRPSHPFDFRFEARNMQLYTGFYQGATVVRLWSVGHGSINATLQSGSVIQGELNAEITQRLHRMAVSDRMSKVKSNPMVVMTANGLYSEMSAGTQEVIGDTGRVEMENVAEAQIEAEVVEAEVVEAEVEDREVGDREVEDREREEREREEREREEREDELFSAPHAACEVERMAHAAHAEVGAKGLETESLFVVEAERLLETSKVLEEIGEVCSSKENEGSSECGGGEDEVVEMTVGQRSGGSAVSSKRGASWNWIRSVVDDGEEKEEDEEREERGEGEENDGREEESKSEETERSGRGEGSTRGKKRGRGRKGEERNRAVSEEEKAEMRRKRNREAAARSNLKRKLRNERVRKDLANLTQRAVKLRVREMMLRDENTRLRNEVRQGRAE